MDNITSINIKAIWAKKLGWDNAIILAIIKESLEKANKNEMHINKKLFFDDFSLSEYAVKHGLRTLQDKGILKINRVGLPCTSFYSLNENKIKEMET